MKIVERNARTRHMLVALTVGTAGVLATACEPPPPPPRPTAEYQFESFAGDGHKACASAPGPDLRTTNPNDPPGFFMGSEIVDGVANDGVAYFAAGSGISLAPTNTEVGTGSEYTLVMLFRLNDVSGYKRLIDFQSGASDTGLYLYNGQLHFYGGGTTVGTKVIKVNEWAQVILTRSYGSGSPVLRGYLDGVEQWSFVDSQAHGVPRNELRFFKDNTSGNGTGEETGGAIARLRLFDKPYGPSIGDPQTQAQDCAT